MNHSPMHRNCQTFTFVSRCWCITLALELITADPHAAQFVESVAITGLEEFLPEPAPTPRAKLIEVQVDPAYAATTDLTKPILVAPMTSSTEGNLGAIVIDGWHRIYRARSEGRTHLPAYLLSADTEDACRIPSHP